MAVDTFRDKGDEKQRHGIIVTQSKGNLAGNFTHEEISEVDFLHVKKAYEEMYGCAFQGEGIFKIIEACNKKLQEKGEIVSIPGSQFGFNKEFVLVPQCIADETSLEMSSLAVVDEWVANNYPYGEEAGFKWLILLLLNSELYKRFKSLVMG